MTNLIGHNLSQMKREKTEPLEGGGGGGGGGGAC